MKFRLYDIKAKKFIIESNELTIGLNGQVLEAMIGTYEEHTCSEYQVIEQDDVSHHFIAQQSTGYFYHGKETWEGDLFDCDGVVLKVTYSPKHLRFILLIEKQPLDNVERIITFQDANKHRFTLTHVGNALTHPELWEVAE